MEEDMTSAYWVVAIVVLFATVLIVLHNKQKEVGVNNPIMNARKANRIKQDDNITQEYQSKKNHAGIKSPIDKVMNPLENMIDPYGLMGW